MKTNKKYIAGFTLVETLITLIIAGAATTAMLFVFNQSQKKMYNDYMEFDIATYGNKAVNLISSKLLDNLTEPVKKVGNWGGFSSYEITFLDKQNYKDNNVPKTRAVERTVRIKLNGSGGFTITEGNVDVTVDVLDGYHLTGGSFNPGDYNQDQNLLTSYVIDSWHIEPLKADSIFHQINPSKTNAFSSSSYEVNINIIIKNEKEGDFGDDLHKRKTYSSRGFSPMLYLLEKARNVNEDGI